NADPEVSPDRPEDPEGASPPGDHPGRVGWCEDRRRGYRRRHYGEPRGDPPNAARADLASGLLNDRAEICASVARSGILYRGDARSVSAPARPRRWSVDPRDSPHVHREPHRGGTPRRPNGRSILSSSRRRPRIAWTDG